MGGRDYRHHEPKKPKKSAKQVPLATVLPLEPVREVEVIGKRKKKHTEEELEEPEK